MYSICYFRLCFSFSCSDYDLTLSKKSNPLNCYSFLHNLLLKTKIRNSLLVTVIVQFAAKTTNLEKAIQFLSLTSSSINILKSHLLFTCKTFMQKCFLFYVEKNFCSRKQWAVGVGAGTPPARPFLYGPGIIFETNKYIYRNGYMRDYCCKSDSIQGKKI